VQACNSLGCSPHSAVKKINVAQTPKIHEIIVPDGNTNGEFNVSWTPSDVNVTRFELERKDLDRPGSDFGSRMTTTDATEAPQTIDAVGYYIFRVRAVNSVGGFENESAWVESKTVKVALPLAVPNIELDIESDTGRYTVSWKPINNTDSYVLEESVDQSASWTTVEEKLKENSKLFTKTDSNHYRYRVTACNRLGFTDESSSKGIIFVHTPQLTSPLR